ncbi:MAG: hypothetical protein J6C30_01440 [Lentisphaeria bacterium]|nr:hypothetical protein [Lentisphaeria bacterium]
MPFFRIVVIGFAIYGAVSNDAANLAAGSIFFALKTGSPRHPTWFRITDTKNPAAGSIFFTLFQNRYHRVRHYMAPYRMMRQILLLAPFFCPFFRKRSSGFAIYGAVSNDAANPAAVSIFFCLILRTTKSPLQKNCATEKVTA